MTKPAAVKAESASAGSKSSVESFDIDAAVKAIEALKPLREALPSIDAKMAWVAQQSERIPKRGRNKDQGYMFSTESDIVAEVSKYASLAGLALGLDYERPDYENIVGTNGKMQQHVKVAATFIITDIITGAVVERRFFGYARDLGDKAIWKAKTGLKKYAHAQTFSVVTGDDPEAHPTGDEDGSGFQRADGNDNAANAKDTASAAEADLADKKAKYERRSAQYKEISALREKMQSLNLLPPDDDAQRAMLLAMLQDVTKNGSGATLIQGAGDDELVAFIDVLNGMIFDAEKEANAKAQACDACGAVPGAEHKDGCPNGAPPPLDADLPEDDPAPGDS